MAKKSKETTYSYSKGSVTMVTSKNEKIKLDGPRKGVPLTKEQYQTQGQRAAEKALSKTKKK